MFWIFLNHRTVHSVSYIPLAAYDLGIVLFGTRIAYFFQGVVFRHQFLRSVMQSDESDSMGQSAELALTYTFDRNETTALFRISMGTTDFMPMYIANCIDQFGNFASKVPHPFALPYVMIRHLISKLNEENSFAMSIIEDQELVLACNSRGVSAATAGNYLYADTDTSVWNFRRMGRDWADIRRKVVSMLGSAETIGKVIDNLQEAIQKFWIELSDSSKSSPEMAAGNS